MSTKDRVLAILETSEDFISGQLIASQLNVSRNAVWKAVNTLKDEGFQVASTTNKGYRLTQRTDSLNAAVILPLIHTDIDVEVFPKIDSTNSEAKRRLNGSLDKDLLIVSDYQEEGRGRLGRAFYSPAETGVYFSLVLKDLDSKKDATLITTVAAVAVCKAIEKLTPLKPQIKWVNDIFLEGYKVGGILTEGIISLETQSIQSIVLGIGMNIVENPDLPETLQDLVGALFKEKGEISRNHLIAEIINQFYILYKNMDDKQYLDEYRKRCFILGKKVSFLDQKQLLEGLASGIDDTGALQIQLPDGSQRNLSYGEVSIKWRYES